MSVGVLVELTELRKLSGILTKEFALGEDGKPEAEVTSVKMVEFRV